MSFLSPVGFKEYKRLSQVNEGSVALLMKTKRLQRFQESVFIVNKPRQFSVKMNELKMVSLSFGKENKVSDECFFEFHPLEEKFTLAANEIITKSGKAYSIRNVPFYDSFIGKY